MASARRELERRAQEAILKRIIENYKEQRDNWLQEPPIRKAILTYSLFRTQNAVLIAAIILLAGCAALSLLSFTPFGILGFAGGVVGGLLILALAEIIFLYLSFKDEKLHAQAVADLLKPEIKFRPATIRDKGLESKVDKALEYWALIDDSVSKAPKGVLKDRLLQTTQEATHWLEAVYNLADRVDKFRENKVIERDLKTVPAALETYRAKLAREDSPEVKAQLERTIADKERQLRILETLQDSMEKADYQLDSTISSLGTIYSQLLLVGNKEEAGSRINRLQEEISEQVYRLEDLTEAMDEVYERSV
jgi:phage shock protein A